MKKLLLVLVAVLGLTLLGGCPGPADPDAKVRVDINLHFQEIVFPLISVVDDPGGRTAVEVPGFTQKFGVVDLIAYNVNTQKSYPFSATGDWVREIFVPEGTYDLFMSSEAQQGFSPYTPTVEFTAEVYGVTIVANTVVDMLPTTDQALVLFTKGSLDSAPTVDVEPDNNNEYDPMSMLDDTNFYYVYVYGTWGFRLSYTIGGTPNSILRTFLAKKIYVYTIDGTGINIGDLFDEVITNN